jgi:hypothetical protein
MLYRLSYVREPSNHSGAETAWRDGPKGLE